MQLWNFYVYETLELSFKSSLFRVAAASMIFQIWRIIANGNVDEQCLQIFVSFRHCWNSFWPALKIPIVVAVVGLLMLLRFLDCQVCILCRVFAIILWS